VAPGDGHEIQVDGDDLVVPPGPDEAPDSIDSGRHVHLIDQYTAEVNSAADLKLSERAWQHPPRSLPMRLLDDQRLTCHDSTSFPTPGPLWSASTSYVQTSSVSRRST